MDEVEIIVWGGVALFVATALLKGAGMLTARIGRIIADHLRDGIVNAVQLSLSNEIRGQVQEAVDEQFQTMKLRISDIHYELRDNGGDSLKDAIRRIEARQSKDRAERMDSMSKVWAALAEQGIDRRSSGSQSGDAEGSY